MFAVTTNVAPTEKGYQVKVVSKLTDETIVIDRRLFGSDAMAARFARRYAEAKEEEGPCIFGAAVHRSVTHLPMTATYTLTADMIGDFRRELWRRRLSFIDRYRLQLALLAYALAAASLFLALSSPPPS